MLKPGCQNYRTMTQSIEKTHTDPTNISNNHTTSWKQQFSSLLKTKKLIFITEMGSKSMGLEAPESDCDFRFIYLEPLEWYLQVFQPKNANNTKSLHQHGEVRFKVEPEDSPNGKELDFVGYELRRTLNLIAESNPTVFEWLRSKHVDYSYKNAHEELYSLLMKRMCKKKLCMYYFETAQGNYIKYIQGNHRNNANCNRKKYLYILRNLFHVIYMRQNDYAIPPMDFDTLRKSVGPLVPNNEEEEDILQKEISTLVKRKRTTAGQWEKEPRIDILDNWIQTQRMELKSFARNAPINQEVWSWKEMDKYFQHYVLEEYSKMTDAYEGIMQACNLNS